MEKFQREHDFSMKSGTRGKISKYLNLNLYSIFQAQFYSAIKF